MAFAARGMDQDGAGVHWRGGDDLRAGASREPERETPLVLPGKFMYARQLSQTVEQLCRGGLRDQDKNQIPDNLAAAANIAGCDGAGDAGQPLERRPKCLRLVRGMVRQPVGTRLAKKGNCLEDVFGG